MNPLGLGAALCLVAAIAAPQPAFEAGERARLDRGEVLTEPLEPTGGVGVAIRATGVVEAPPSDVWPALRDCEHYAEFLPGVRVAELVDREDEIAVCYTEIQLPWPLPRLVSKNRVVESRVDGGGYARRWSLIEGNYGHLTGSWHLYPWGEDGRRTLAVYQADFDPQTPVPDFLLRRAQASTAPDLFDSVRERVQELRGPILTPTPR